MRYFVVTLLCLLSAAAFAQENVGGSFYTSCGPTDGAAVTMELDTHLRITVYGSIEPEGAYRTKEQTFEGEKATMEIGLCDNKMDHCKSVEGVLTVYKVNGEEIEGAIEYFDGTEVQGDSESIQGPMAYFKIHKDKTHIPPVCG
jgi:hypothetical protein